MPARHRRSSRAVTDAATRIGAQQRLIAALGDPHCYPHPAGALEVVETHISWVVLAGDYAYKFKKALALGFLDFSTLAKRRIACLEEVRLNRRTAPQIYIDVVAIGGTRAAPRLGGGGPALDYAVRMHRFARDDGLDFLLARGAVSRADIEMLAHMIADFHAGARRDRDGVYGAPAAVLEPALDNFSGMPAVALGSGARERLAALDRWTRAEHSRIATRLEERRKGGFVRECHGDLHMANLLRHGGRMVAFDCIEFNPLLRWIDVASDLAFTLMDLRHRGRVDFARVALNAWLERSCDWDAAALLPFYQVYRAMVRVKVGAIRASQDGAQVALHAATLADCRAHLALAESFTLPAAPCLVITHGVSGAGKSHVAAQLVERRDWIRVRADVLRKRLAGLGSLESSGAAIGEGIYSTAATAQVYAHLAAVATCLLNAGHSVIVDASFLKRRQRDLLRDVARQQHAPFAILAVRASRAELARRITRRAAAGTDPSEASLAVLKDQIANRETLGADERSHAVHLDTGTPFGADDLAARLEARADVPRPGAAR